MVKYDKELVDRIYTEIRTDSFGKDKLQLFIEAIEENPIIYVPRFMYTLELNKIEAIAQGVDSPAIFRKECDEIGLLRTLHIRQPKGSVINLPRKFYTNEEVNAVLEYLETGKSASERLNVMLSVNKIECRIMACLPDSELDKGPIFIREVDKLGIPTSYRFTGKQDFDLLSKYFDTDKIAYLRELHFIN